MIARIPRILFGALVILGLAGAAAGPEQDRAEFRAFYQARFPALALADFVLGAYAIDPGLRSQWEEINEFPPYEFAIDEGRMLYEQPFPNGRRFADCLPESGSGAAHRYPRFDPEAGEVVTLAVAINRCRVANGAAAWSYGQGPLVSVQSYLAAASRGQPLEVEVPALPGALRAYAEGRRLFYSKRGQRNFSCADCHMQAAGKHLREQTLAPLLGVVNHYPVYGLRWGAMGTLHARFAGCFEQVGAEPYPAQSPEFRALEYFLAAMGSGLPYSAPGIHR